MKQVQTTIILSAFAVVSLIAAITFYYGGSGGPDSQNELIGEVFYPDFTDPVQASSLKLVVWDGENRQTKEFEVRKMRQTRTINGEKKEVELWAIPDHSNYPVESPERLRETAGSVMNIERLSLAGKSKDEHERLGVIDPNDKDAKLKESSQIGDRIILQDDSGNTVCDLIIGNAVDAEMENEISAEDRELIKGERYYVRQPDENETYIAELNLQITTEFSQWIDDDLLQVGEANVEKIQFLNYEVEDKLIQKFGGRVPVRSNFEEFVVEKENNAWKIDDLKTETEELDSMPLNSFESDLGRLTILEVQPKPTYQDSEMKILNGDLSINAPKGMGRNDQIRIQQQVLGPQGFIIGLEDEKKINPSLLSTNGELKFGTDAGLVYHLFFGYDVKLKEGSFEFAASGEKKEDEKGDETAGPTNNDSPEEKKGKIMSVHVTFDPELIPKPEMPVKPMPPAKPELGTPDADEKPENPSKVGPPSGSDEAVPESQPADDLKSDPGKKEASTDKAKTESKTKPGDQAKNEKGKADPPKKESTKSDKPTEKKAEGKKKESKSDQTSFRETRSDRYLPVSFLIKQEQEKTKKEEKSKTDKPQQGTKQEKKSGSDKTDLPKSEPKQGDPAKTDQATKKSDPAKETSDAKQEKEKKGDSSAKQPSKTDNPDPGKQESDMPPKDLNQQPEKSSAELFTERMKAYDDAMKQYESELETYNEQMKQYEKDMKAYEETVEKNRKRVAELNARFGDWFYIIDAGDLDKVKLTRTDIVKPKSKDPAQPPGGMPNLNFPGGQLPPGLNIPGLGGKQDPRANKRPPMPSGQEGPGKPESKTEKKKEPSKDESDAGKVEKAEVKKSENKEASKDTSPKSDPSKQPSPKSEKKSAAEPKNGGNPKEVEKPKQVEEKNK